MGAVFDSGYSGAGEGESEVVGSVFVEVKPLPCPVCEAPHVEVAF
jgi:hypothetical protein